MKDIDLYYQKMIHKINSLKVFHPFIIKNSTLVRKAYFSSDKETAKEVSLMMNEKIATMKETLNKTSPRSFSLLFILASVPAFYFIN